MHIDIYSHGSSFASCMSDWLVLAFTTAQRASVLVIAGQKQLVNLN